MIDTHVHLQDERYAPDIALVLERAAQAGVHVAIVPGTTLQDSHAAIELGRATSTAACRLYATVGIHPTEAYQLDDAALAELTELAQSPDVVAIGEIGLDYYWPAKPNRGWVCAEPNVQRRALELQLQLASQLDLPVVIHDRDAHEDTLSILETWKAADPRARGTLHAYAAGPDLLDRALALGLHIGIDGPVTYKKASRVKAVAQRVPLANLLLETDGPYLPPVPHRGERNEPSYIPLIAAAIADLRGIAPQAVGEAAAANARRLFRLPV